MIEIYKHQFRDLSAVIAKVKNRNYRFIIFIDDLSFEENEVEYKFLKAVIEGGVETKPDNILLYATSNRRNLIRETWKDRADMEHENDVHHSDTLEEKLSLSARFGVRINYSIPNRTQFQEMVRTLAQRQGLTVPGGGAAGGGQQVGTAPRRRLRPHGPAVYQLYGGQSAFGSKGMSRQPGPKSGGSGCLFCFPAFCLARERKVCYHFTAKMTRVQRGDAGWNGC